MTNYISKLQINAFRGIRDLTLDDLSSVNVLVGANNSGKTSVLEAISFLSCPYYPSRIASLASMRRIFYSFSPAQTIADDIATLFRKERNSYGVDFYTMSLQAVFSHHDLRYQVTGQLTDFFTAPNYPSRQFSVNGSYQFNGESTSVNYTVINGQEIPLETDPRGMFTNYRLYYLPSIAPYYAVLPSLLSVIPSTYNKAELLKLVSDFGESIQDISIVNNEIYLTSEQSGILPLYSYGSGLQKVALLSMVLLVSRDGVLLIDEIDDTINISAFQAVFPWFLKKCNEFNIQAFVTTHSAEAIDTILESQNNLDNIRIITLRKTPKTHTTIAKVRTGNEALADRENFKMELRV